MAVVQLKDLLDAGVHFGHQTSRWNPKMKRFIFEERNGIHIVDLQKTQRLLDYATQYVRNVAQKGGTVMLVGTKGKIRDIIREEAENCGMPYVCERWLGGMLTNMRTIRHSIERLDEIDELENDGTMERLPKKEQSMMRREAVKLHKNLDGIRAMSQPPDVVFVVDIRREHLALAEARKLNIPIVALVDTNCDPDKVEFIVPGNDDAISSVRLVTAAIANAIREGFQYYEQIEKERESREAEERAQRKKEKKAPKATSKKPRSDASKKFAEMLREQADASAEPEDADAAAGEDAGEGGDATGAPPTEAAGDAAPDKAGADTDKTKDTQGARVTE